MVQEGAYYRNKHSGDLVEVIESPDSFASGDPDNKQVELKTLESDEWYSVFADNFRSGYDFVAESREDL
jgi:hypothetical protein